MSFDILAARSYGTGTLGDVTNPAGQINSYAAVTAVANDTITIDLANASLGAYEQFAANSEILLHISGARNSSATAANLGKYLFAKITAVEGNVLTLNTAPLELNPTNYFYQAITVAQFKTLTISETISPLAFDETNGYGGILALKCSNKLVMNGSINLVDKGLQTAAYRPELAQEQSGTLDTDQLSGHENYETCKHFTLQKGDGACLIIAKKISCKSTARIGNPALNGVQRCRGADDSYNLPTGVTNIGGSSILIVAPTIEGFSPDVIAKYRSKTLEAGQGLCRCYIATESRLPFDEGLYAFDVINTPERLTKETLIDGFGSGIHGAAITNKASARQNNYAKVTSISNGGKTFTLTKITTDGTAKFERNALVMIHAATKNANNYAHVGRFIVSKVVGITNTTAGKLQSITLEHSLDELGLTGFNVDKYNFQAIAIPQYTSFNGGNSLTPDYKDGRGGIFAIAVNGVCDLRDKTISVEGVGNSSYSLAYTSNNRMKNRLPIGQGHGSVFILAKTFKVNSATRIGSKSSGNAFGGASHGHQGGGYRGHGIDATGGSGLRGGQQYFGHNGGFCSNASDGGSHDGGLQGASIFIVAESIDGLCLDCLCTGGQGGWLCFYLLQ